MIEAVDLTKRYSNGQLALDALNLRVGCGEVYCLLGANGAGKTTAINLFLNFIKPTSGQATIHGIDVAVDALKAKRYLYYLAEDVTLYGHFTARENVEFFARLGGARGLNKHDYCAVLREVGLQERLFEEKVKHFPKGVRQKVGLAIAMVLDAPALLLDEPTSGLDPKAVAEFLETLDQLRSRSKAILMSTHDIFRAKEISNRVGILKEGRKVMERTSEELRNEDLQALYLDYMRGGYRHDAKH